MKKIIIVFLFLICICILILGIQSVQKKSLVTKTSKQNMKLYSTVFNNNGDFPGKYTCDGDNINPPLSIMDIPQNTKSLVLIVDDPDAPSKTWVHWIVYNIDTEIRNIQENSIPDKAELGITDFGKPGYGGPCPPSGTHRYFFRLYALDSRLDGLHNPDRGKIDAKMVGHVIAYSELVGKYKRK